MSASELYSTYTAAQPSRAEEVTLLTPSRNLTSDSNALTTLVSISSALAPDQATETVTISMPKSGKN
jgi:hypothetical protein|uniref:Uncharacterized protein n=1 Tax=uncultured marine thaumarchaeote KM3_45_G08 TaxID=1456157 RepID=A0A075H2V6_9ARCH|nr:hypothetical protein [uncultured marine thaumarchaeote KM3_45_G08]